MTIQWYPGHMTRAKRMIREELKLVDGLLEVADARVPVSSRNPELAELTAKPLLIVLTKADWPIPRPQKAGRSTGRLRVKALLPPTFCAARV